MKTTTTTTVALGRTVLLPRKKESHDQVIDRDDGRAIVRRFIHLSTYLVTFARLIIDLPAKMAIIIIATVLALDVPRRRKI